MSKYTGTSAEPPAAIEPAPEPIRYDWHNTPYGTIRLWVSLRPVFSEDLNTFLCRVSCWGGADKYEPMRYISFELGKDFAPVIDTILQRVYGLIRQPAEEWMGRA